MSRIEYKTRDQMKWMRESGLVVAEIHRSLREAARPGITTAELDEVSADVPVRISSTTTVIPPPYVFPPMTLSSMAFLESTSLPPVTS